MRENNGTVKLSRFECFLKAVSDNTKRQDGLKTYVERLEFSKMLIDIELSHESSEKMKGFF